MTSKQRRRVLLLAAAAVFVTYGCFLFLTPLYPNVAHDLEVGPDRLGLIVGVSSILSALLQIPVGIATDRVGRRPFLVAGMLMVVAAQVLRWQSASTLVFTLAQAVFGLSLPLTASAAYAAVADAYAGANRAQALGTITASISLGQVGGLLTTAVLGQLVHWRLLSLALVAFPLVLLPALLRLPEPPRAEFSDRAGQRAAAALRFLVTPAAAALAGIAALALGCGIAATYLLPFALREIGYGANATGIFLLPFVIGAVLGPPLSGRMADRLGTRPPMLGCLLISCAATGTVAFTGPRPLAVVPCFFAMGAAVGSVLSLAAHQIAELVTMHPGTGMGAALGGLRLGQAAGPSVGPAVAGVLYAGRGFADSFLGLSAALAGGLVLTLLAVRPLPGRAVPEPE